VRFADFKFVASPPSLVAGACVSAAVCGLKGESWCRAVRLHAILRDVTSADTVRRHGTSATLSVIAELLLLVVVSMVTWISSFVCLHCEHRAFVVTLRYVVSTV